MEHSQISFQTETESCSSFRAKPRDLFQGIPALYIHNVAFKIFRSWSNNILASKAAFHRSLLRVLLCAIKNPFSLKTSPESVPTALPTPCHAKHPPCCVGNGKRDTGCPIGYTNSVMHKETNQLPAA